MKADSLSVKDIVEATGGRLLHGELDGVEGISIDSRSIGEGELFVAIKGARFDGHDFLGEALRKGVGAIVSIPPAEPPRGKAIIHVPSTIKALQDIARYLRVRSGVSVVGITGTNGKTTTKEMAAAVLGKKFRVLKNTGNLNNQIGLPLSLLALSEKHEVAVLEMGASAPGDIRELSAVAMPECAVLTNVGPAHMEGFSSIEAVRRTKLEILEFARTAVINGDDAFLAEGMEGYGGRVIRYGLGPDAEVRASDIRLGDRDAGFTLAMAGESVAVNLKVTGRFNVYNALAAAAVGMLYGVEAGAAREALEGMEAVPMRLQIRDFDGATVISDVYNANPASMEEAVKELVRLRRGRAVAVLGDMLELGSYAEVAHRRLGTWMSSLPVDLFIAVGPLMAFAAEEFKGRSLVVPDSAQARDLLLEEYRGGDVILVKGSRGMRMERVISDI
ncbi:MAG: UDP-N-acetylmuramoyl-tripeptide--D-alanyl-D-alanine ligase [Thermodesulfovibrionales bacterium]